MSRRCVWGLGVEAAAPLHSRSPGVLPQPLAVTHPDTPQAYLDTHPPRNLNESLGVWQLGNRVIAAGRELLYWADTLSGNMS
jgi:hypothetical protein